MNCKPGDLAVIVHTPYASENWVIGRVVRCISVFMESGHACWVVEPKIPGHSGVCDIALRPIRDPGDDATDESHAWLPPVPTTQKETA